MGCHFLLQDTDKLIPNFIRKSKRPRIAKTILKKENEVGGISLLGFKTQDKATVIKLMWY